MYGRNDNFSNMPSDKKGQSIPKPAQRFVEISGEEYGGRPKAHVMLRYFEDYSDGSTRDLQVLNIDKPIVSVFKHPGYVNVLLDFKQARDMDLRMVWSMLKDYSNPINSMDYLPEEMESGYYEENGTQKLVFFPLLELTLSPIGRENEFQMHGVNPVFFQLGPKSPAELDPCVLQFVFPEEWFIVDEMKNGIDLQQLKHEVMDELQSEMMEEL